MISLSYERPEDGPAIEHLLDDAFGADRLAKTSYRYRHGRPPVRSLSRVARCRRSDRLVGSLRYWRVAVAGGAPTRRVLLLGPLAVTPRLHGAGIGRMLVFSTLDMAAWAGFHQIFLVGDLAYYAKFGFSPAAPLGYIMPGESPKRLLQRRFLGIGPGPGGILAPFGDTDIGVTIGADGASGEAIERHDHQHGPHPEFLDHRPYRSRQVDPGRPADRNLRRSGRPGDEGSDSR